MKINISELWKEFTTGDKDKVIQELDSRAHEVFDFPANEQRAMLGCLFCMCGHREKGLAMLSVGWNEASANAAGLAGALLLANARFEIAIPTLRRAVEGDADDIGAHLINLGRALTLSGEPLVALPYLQRGVKCSSHDHEVATQSLCETYIALDRVDDALALMPENISDKDAVITRATVLSIANRHDEATALLQQALAENEEDIVLLTMSAELALVKGRYQESAKLLQKANLLEPDNTNILSKLAHSGMKAYLPSYAKEAACALSELANKDDASDLTKASALEAEAFVLSAEGQLDEALDKYAEALKLAPNMAAALSGLGQLYLETGKVDLAKEQFECLRAVAPMMGWNQLLNIREVPEDPQVLEQMERLARQPSIEGPMRYSLLLSVSSAWDKKKEYDKAMSLAIEANKTATTHLHYKPEQHRQKIDSIIARYSKEFCTSRKDFGDTSSLPVFVLGMPRSGTTLTEQILASHSQVFGAGELGFIGEQIVKMEAWQHKLGSGLTYPECVADVSPNIATGFAQSLLEKLQAYDPKATRVIDKLPHNFEHIGLIKLLFPNATIFHVRREPRDIAVSNFMTDYAAKFGGMGFAYDLDWIGQQLVDHNRLMQHWHEVFPGQIMEVVYEELVEDTPQIAHKMIEFMGLEWEDNVLEHHSLERSVKTASVWQVRQPIYKSSKARWKRYEKWLDPLEKALQEKISDPEPCVMPSIAPSLFTRGTQLLGEQKLLEAKQCFIDVIKQYPAHAAALHFLGAAYLQLGEIDSALSYMRKSVQLLPRHATWFKNLAIAEKQAGNLDAAVAANAYADKLLASTGAVSVPHNLNS